MNLRNRALLILGLTFFVFFIIIAAVSLSVTLSGLDRIEYQAMGDSMKQVHSAINAEAASLLITTHDWAWWDDMAEFSVNHNAGFLERNANTDSMATLRIHYLIILDNDGNVLYGRALSPDFRSNMSVPDDIMAIIRNTPTLMTHAETSPGIAGLFMSSQGPIVLASAPILHSDQSGPVSGTVIMGRYLEYGPLQRITDMTGYQLTIDWQGKEAAGIPRPDIQKLLSGEETLVLVPDNETMTTGYGTVRDLAGKNMVIGISMERQLYRIGLANITTYLVLLALWAIMTGLIVAVVMDWTVLQRMGRLTDHVRSLSENREEVPLPVLSGDDELAMLEKTIIASRADLMVRERQLRSFVSAMPGPAGLFSRQGRILLANPALAEYLHRPLGEVTGADIRSCLSGDEFEKYNRFVQEAIRKKETVHFENETGERTFLMSYYPVLDSNGEVIQLGLLTFDISERKRLENALQKVTKKIALLNTVIFSDIQNKVFVQMGYLELAKNAAADPRIKSYIEKEEAVVREIQSSLRFAKQYNDMGMSPPRWQNVLDVMLFAVSHLDLGTLARDFHLEGLDIYADSLLERVFVTLVENLLLHAKRATIIRAGFTVTDDNVVIFVEDDGPGIPEDRKEEIFKKGIGTGGSSSLFLSREILSITGITIRENGVFGKGARFEIAVPKGSFRVAGK
jgi:PAS domain S-box-containing protein